MSPRDRVRLLAFAVALAAAHYALACGSCRPDVLARVFDGDFAPRLAAVLAPLLVVASLPFLRRRPIDDE